MKFVFGTKLNPRYIEMLENVGKEVGQVVQVVSTEEKEEIKKEVVDAEALVTWWSNFDPSFVEMGKNLRWIQTLTAGVDNFLIPEIIDRKIILTSAKGIHGIPMAEHMFGMLLGLTRGLYELRHGQKAKSWDKPRVEELYGKTLVILGLGNIGREVAKRAKAFGMNVVGVKRTPELEEHVDKVYGPDELMQALAEGDIVLSILPYTPDTYHMLNTAQFNQMKNTAIFMSFGRGDVVDEASLIAALKGNKIRAAILDVFENEPLTPESPLWEMEKVYISPHMSALSNHYMERAMSIIAENLKAYLQKQPMRNKVDFKKGY